jgi:very-short-patch-repair endonuclease
MQRHSQLTRRKALKNRAAKRLRTPAVVAERQLWALLRHAPVAGLKFVRRMPAGPFVAAFCCPAARLVVEIGNDAATKTQWLEDHGFRVLVFPVDAVIGNPQLVRDAIAQAFEIRAVPRP